MTEKLLTIAILAAISLSGLAITAASSAGRAAEPAAISVQQH